jgi:hypothetical protein
MHWVSGVRVWACVAAMLVATASTASADSIANVSAGTATIVHDGSADGDIFYTGFTFSPQFLQGNILSKTLDATLTQSLDYTYSELDYGGGIRLSEIVTTPVPVTSYRVDLTTQGTFFFISPDAPSQVSIFVDPLNVAPSTVTVIPPPVGATVALSNSNQTVTFTFAAPVTSFGVHIPVMSLSGAPDTFSMTQTAIVPLPLAAVGGLAMMGATGLTRLCRRGGRRLDAELV